MSSIFGSVFKVSTFGESHGVAVGVVIDGCPAGIPFDADLLQTEMTRRRPGQSKITTRRDEADMPEVLSGVFDGHTTGAPIALLVRNKDARSKDYSHIANKYRPSHADFTFDAKYGIRDYRGGGRSSARETLARVAAGAVAKMFLQTLGVTINACVSQVGNLKWPVDLPQITPQNVEANIVRCPDANVANQMIDLIDSVRKQGDTIGGVVTCIARGVPPGWGEPVFDKLHARLGQAMLSINAVKGFEYGSGFAGVAMRGSEHNDAFTTNAQGSITTKTNRSGGIQGGISNGQDIYFSVAFKPVATIIPDQQSVDKNGNPTTVAGRGRHDPCVVPRAVPIVEGMAALVLADMALLSRTNKV